MSELASIGCCCNVPCNRIATICDCSAELYPNVPEEVLVSCENIAHWLQTSQSDPMIVRLYYGGGGNPSGACYQVGSASPTWPPPGQDPTPIAAGSIAAVLESCGACCETPPPPFCWAIATACMIPGDPDCSTPLGETVYVPLGQAINGQCPTPTAHIWKHAGRCIAIGPGSTIVTTIPPNAIQSPAQNQYPTCIACCGQEPPMGCPLNCNGCPNTLTITVPGWTMPFDGGITIVVQGGMIPVNRILNTCNWETFGDPVEFTATIIEPGQPPQSLPFFLRGAVSCNPNTGWAATIDGSVFCGFVSNNFDPCPFAGGYNCQMPPGGCDSCPPNVSVG